LGPAVDAAELAKLARQDDQPVKNWKKPT